MNGMEGFTTPIRTVLGAQIVYTVIFLSLGLSLYRWKANRVCWYYALYLHFAIPMTASRSKFLPMARSFLS
jgi:hypothetical protein